MLRKDLALAFAVTLVAWFSSDINAAEQPSVAAAITANTNELNFSEANTVVKTEVRWLELSNGKFLALQRDYLAATKHGVAILLPDVNNLPTNNDGIEQLRVGLNNHGWITLSIMPPTGSTAKVSYQQQLLERLISAQQASKQLDRNFIIIAQGSQASYLAKFYLDQMLPLPDAIILLDAKSQLSEIEVPQGKAQYTNNFTDLSAQISKLPLKILDIYRLRDDLSADMALRKKLSVKNKQDTYRQTELFDSDNSRQLLKTVYGWLKTSGLN